MKQDDAWNLVIAIEDLIHTVTNPGFDAVDRERARNHLVNQLTDNLPGAIPTVADLTHWYKTRDSHRQPNEDK